MGNGLDLDFLKRDSMSNDWPLDIRDSEIFVPIVNSEYLKGAITFCQWDYAKYLKKQFHVIKVKSLIIPNDWIEGIDKIAIFEFETKAELRVLIKQTWDL